MKQGEIWYADLNPVQGREQAGFRPVVIISGDLLNQYLNVAIAIPLTTSIKNYKGNPILTPGATNKLKETSEMLVFHIRSISKDRLTKKIGNIEAHELKTALATLNDILTY